MNTLKEKLDELNQEMGQSEAEGSKKMAEVFEKSNFSMLTDSVVSHFESLISDPSSACVVLFGMEVNELAFFCTFMCFTTWYSVGSRLRATNSN